MGADISDAAEQPCSECGAVTLTEVLVRCDAPFSGLVCPRCADELAHADERCECTLCVLVEAERERIRRLVDARAHGGFREGALEMLGWKK